MPMVHDSWHPSVYSVIRRFNSATRTAFVMLARPSCDLARGGSMDTDGGKSLPVEADRNSAKPAAAAASGLDAASDTTFAPCSKPTSANRRGSSSPVWHTTNSQKLTHKNRHTQPLHPPCAPDPP